jgi:hypothetical protein
MRNILLLIFCLCAIVIQVSAQRAKPPIVRKKSFSNYPERYLREVVYLPVVDEIEVIATKVIPFSESGKIDCNDPINKCNANGHMPMWELDKKTISGVEAQKLAMLWRSLRLGTEGGCFNPGYQLRFKKAGKSVLITNVCFHCCNANLQDGNIFSICGGRGIRAFKRMVTKLVPHE